MILKVIKYGIVIGGAIFAYRYVAENMPNMNYLGLGASLPSFSTSGKSAVGDVASGIKKQIENNMKDAYQGNTPLYPSNSEQPAWVKKINDLFGGNSDSEMSGPADTGSPGR